MDAKSKGVINKQVKEEMKKTDEQTVRILMKWITAILFLKFFWLFEKIIFIIPAAPIKLWLGLWIMLPNYHGEFFMYNLLSDKLDKFEREVRKIRNTIVAKFIFFVIHGTRFLFLKFKPYIHTDNLRKFRDIVQHLDVDCEREMELRRKIQQHNKDVDFLVRDSSVLNSDTLKMINQRSATSLSSGNHSSSTNALRGKVAARILESRQQEEQPSYKTQSNSMYKRMTTQKQSTNATERTGSSYQPQNTSRPMKLVKKKNDLNESVYSQYLEEEELYGEDQSFDRKMNTMSMIPNIDQQFEILSQPNNKRTNKPSVAVKQQMNRHNQSISVLDQSVDSTFGTTKRKN
eukprot:403332771